MTYVILLQSLINAPTIAVFIANFVIVILIFLSATMAASEIAFFSLSNAEIDALRESDDKIDNRTADLLERPRYLLSTILISNNLVNMGVIITSYFVTRQMFNFHAVYIFDITVPGFVLELIWNILLVSFLLVLFGEATPKVYATHNKLKIARFMSGTISLLVKFFSPVNLVLVNSMMFLEKRLKPYNEEIDIEEINKAIELTVEKKESKQDARLLKGIVHFGNIMVKQVMRPRAEMVVIDKEMNFKELMISITETGYSRYPVYEETPDNIIGVLNIKDLVEHLNQKESFGWQGLIREPFFVPETKRIDDLLREMQRNRKHLAVVVDEYGATSGLITLEDILEEVVGDITDEFDDAADNGFKKLDERNFLFDGKTQLVDACRLMEIDPSTFEEIGVEVETLGGLVLEIAGRIPKNGEEVKSGNYRFTIISVLNNRIEKVKITNEG